MAHFARIENGTVTQVVVVHNDDAPDEATGQAFLASLGLTGEWVQTSYSATIRGKYAGIGDTWDGTAFVESDTVEVAKLEGLDLTAKQRATLAALTDEQPLGER